MEIISAKYLLTLGNGDEPLEDGAIAIELGKIASVGTLEELKKKYPEAQLIEHNNHVLMPGLVNAESHLDLKLFYEKNRPRISDAAETNDYIEWIINIFKYKKSASTTEVINSVQQGLQVAIDSGTTCVGDTTTFEGTYNIIAEMGMRAVVYNEIYSGNGDEAQDLFENALALSEKYFDPTKASEISSGYAPTSPYLLSKNLLTILSQHAQDSDVPVKIHAAESFAEMEVFFEAKGPILDRLFPAIGWGDQLPPMHKKTPISFLSEIGFLSSSPAIVGGLHLSENCLKLLARNMCRVICCPTNNTFFAHGSLPVGKLRTHGIPIGIGTGYPVKSHALSMWDEMREALKTTPGSPTPKDIIQMATIGSARAIGLENQIGTLTEGKMADYIVVDLPPGYDIDKSYIYGALIRNTHHFNIRKTVIGGEVLKSI